MKNRLFCLALCLLMVASAVLTGCSGKTTEEVVSDIEKETSENARTLTMWMVSEQPVDEEMQTRITKAVNDITQSKFKAKMVLYFLTDAEYRDVVTNTIRASEDSKAPRRRKPRRRTAERWRMRPKSINTAVSPSSIRS